MTNNNTLLNTLYYKILEIDIIKDSSLSSKVFSGAKRAIIISSLIFFGCNLTINSSLLNPSIPTVIPTKRIST